MLISAIHQSDSTYIYRYYIYRAHLVALEKEMKTHYGVLAWRIPGMGEHPGLPSMESHRVGHDRSDLAAAAAAPGGSVIKPHLPMQEMWDQSLGLEDPWRSKQQPTPIFLPGKSSGQRSLAGCRVLRSRTRLNSNNISSTYHSTWHIISTQKHIF